MANKSTEELAEEALNVAFRHIQDALGVETGDEAAVWVDERDWEKARQWLSEYARHENCLARQ